MPGDVDDPRENKPFPSSVNVSTKHCHTDANRVSKCKKTGTFYRLPPFSNFCPPNSSIRSFPTVFFSQKDFLSPKKFDCSAVHRAPGRMMRMQISHRQQHLLGGFRCIGFGVCPRARKPWTQRDRKVTGHQQVSAAPGYQWTIITMYQWLDIYPISESMINWETD